MSYVFHLSIMIGIYLPLAYSLNITLGFGGLLCLCHAIFYGIGAYAYALLVKSLHFHPIAALALTVAVTGVLSLFVGIVSLRFRGDLFVFVTLGFQMIIFVMLYNLTTITNGPYGIAEIPRPEFFGWTLNTHLQYTGLVFIMNLVLLSLVFIIYSSPFGIILKALRENELAGESLGIQTSRVYLQAFIFAAAIASIPGAFYAAYVTYIDPTSFTLKESIFQVAILLLGGAGNRMGPLIGVIIMILLPEILRFAGLPDEVSHNVREILYGLMIVILMYFRPQGIAGEFKVT